MIIKRFFLIGAAMLVSAGMAQAVTPLWMRDVRISPDAARSLSLTRVTSIRSMPKAARLKD